MKTIVNIISWVAFLAITLAIGLTSLFCGAYVASCLCGLWHLSGWMCLLVTPVMYVASFAVCMFFMLGLERASINYQN